jgi:cell wall-associated protease
LSLTSLSSSRTSPQVPGTSITFTASASGGTGPYQFKWWLFDGEVWTVARNWGSSSTYAWTPTQTGSDYVIGVWVRDSTMRSDIGTYARSMPFVVSSSSSSSSSAPLTVTALSANRISPQPRGTSITFAATATGGRSPYQYKWWLFDGTTWTIARDWSSSATWAWTPNQPGNYQVGVWVRDSTMTSDIGTYNKTMTFAISGTSTTSTTTSGPLRITAVTSNLASPQPAGTRVTFTASAAGGKAPYQYKWWVFDGIEWKILRDWSTSNTYTWTALPRGSNYFVAVWLRDSTTKANVGTLNYSVPFVTR